MSSPPSLTHSPNIRVTRSQRQEKNKSRRQSSPPITTAALTDLLPRRRQERNRDDGDSDSELDASGLGDDDDEITHIEARAARRRAKTTPLNRGGPSHSKSQSTGTSKRGRPRRTYQQRFSDKENEGGEEGESGLTHAPDDTFEPTQGSDPSTSDELKNAIKKFKEVDKWELAFEEITQSSSSPTTGR